MKLYTDAGNQHTLKVVIAANFANQVLDIETIDSSGKLELFVIG